MKTPEEIKKRIKCFLKMCDGTCNMVCGKCEVYEAGYSLSASCSDALAYIQQLEAELDDEKNKNEILIFDNDKLMEEIAQVERERDELLKERCSE